MSTVSDRIKQIIAEVEGVERGVQTSFAKRLECSRYKVSEWVRGKIQPTHEYVVKLQHIYNIDPHWLLKGEGDMFISPIKSPENLYDISKTELNSDEELPTLPDDLKDYAASLFIVEEDSRNNQPQLKPLNQAHILPRRVYRREIALRIPDNLMSPNYSKNDIVSIAPISLQKITIRTSDNPYVVVSEHGIQLRYLVQLESEKFVLRFKSKDSKGEIAVDNIKEVYEILTHYQNIEEKQADKEKPFSKETGAITLKVLTAISLLGWLPFVIMKVIYDSLSFYQAFDRSWNTTFAATIIPCIFLLYIFEKYIKGCNPLKVLNMPIWLQRIIL